MDQDYVKKERMFLHEISNQLVIAQGMASFVTDSIDDSNEDSELVKKRADKLLASIEKMTDRISERRTYLHSLSED